MRKSSFSISASLLIVAVSGCSQLDQSITDCDNLREEIVEMSEEDRRSRGCVLVKLRKPKALSKSDKQISCSGLAIWTDGGKASITYQSCIDEDGDQMIEYEVN